jgi:hypothetical protein
MAGAPAKACPTEEAATILKIILTAEDAFGDHAIAMTPARDAPMRATRCHGEAAPPR